MRSMEKRSISFSPPDISEDEINEVAETLRSGWITTGPRVKEFEKRLSEYYHTRRTVCLSSATAAEELILRIIGIEKGDEVIVPAYTYTSTAAAAIHAGATVKFIDSQPDSCEMDYDAVEAAITERTKAIIPVDIGGVICDYDRIFEAVKNMKNKFKPANELQEAIGRVPVVADCAHAIGACREGKMAGEIADFSSFSFHAVKNLTTAEGGAATWRTVQGIDDEKLYRQFQLYSLHGQSKDALSKTQLGTWEYDILGPWYKCNMTDIMGAIGLRQMERYGGLLERRKEIVNRYDSMCDELGLKHLIHYGENHKSSAHLYMARVPGIDVKERNSIIAEMAERGIACNVHYKPLPMMTAYKNYGWEIKDFPNAFHYYEEEITLPLHTQLSDDDVEYVITNFTDVVKKHL